MSEVLSDSTLRSPRWKEAEDAANKLTDIYSVPPIPVVEIAERSGVEVVRVEFKAHKDLVAGFCDFKNRKLYVNKEDPQVRQTFTIAHELGHWMLHRHFFEQHPEKYPVLARFQATDKGNPFEQEANHFAANLLVPMRLLRPVARAPVSALATIFQVSKTMMEYRIKNV